MVNTNKFYRLTRRDKIIIHQVRIGHTFLTHGHLLKKESPPLCSAFQTLLTVEHVLLLCPTWNAIRKNHFTVTNLLDLFNQVTPRCIVDFIKEIGFFVDYDSLTSIVFTASPFVYTALTHLPYHRIPTSSFNVIFKCLRAVFTDSWL
jgi:hypothetical protein